MVKKWDDFWGNGPLFIYFLLLGVHQRVYTSTIVTLIHWVIYYRIYLLLEHVVVAAEFSRRWSARTASARYCYKVSLKKHSQQDEIVRFSWFSLSAHIDANIRVCADRNSARIQGVRLRRLCKKAQFDCRICLKSKKWLQLSLYLILASIPEIFCSIQRSQEFELHSIITV